MAIYQFLHFSFDDSRGSLHAIETDSEKTDLASQLVSSQTIQLRHKVANLLSFLIVNRERIVSKEELLKTLWQHGDYRENSLTQSIRELRAALGDNAKSPQYVKTYPQRGYQWIQPILQYDNNSALELDSTAPLSSEPLLTQNEENKSIQGQKINTVSDASVERTSNELDATQYKSSETIINKGKGIAKRYRVLILTVICLCSLLLWFTNSRYSPLGDVTQNPLTDAYSHSSSEEISSLLVLPFINATNNANMAWLELGLADMLAIDLGRHDALTNNQLHVTPPAIANALLINAQLQWPSLPVHIRSLLREHNISAAIFASVRLHNSQQVLDFQIIYANGKTKQGSISYPSLPAAVQSISQQLLHLINPKQNKLNKQVEEDPIASLALAQGMQALQQEGALYAKKYFQATLVLEDNNYWALAYSARSSVALGLWDIAENDFNRIPKEVLTADPSLDAFVHYWRAEIAYRRGDTDLISKVEQASDKAIAASDAKQMARSYRLKAKIAWHHKAWEKHKQWTDKAESLFAINDGLHVEADKLFYLGNPNNTGLEKSPENNLEDNKAKLLKALNFYIQLGNQNMIAASQLAIAQNYTFALDKRTAALNSAIELYKQLQQPYDLAQALNYAGFFQMQLHNGAQASQYFSQTKVIAEKLNAKPLIEVTEFYLAFASLDQGLDQQSLGRHGKNEKKLMQAIEQLSLFISTKPTADLHASALVFLGWANTELGLYDLALKQLKQAKEESRQLGMETTLAYSSYSMMRIYLSQQNYQAVTAMADETIVTRFQATYLARAFYELGQVNKAISVLSNFKVNHKNLWQPEDELRLGMYQSSLTGVKFQLLDEPKAHLVYCESDWLF